MKKLTFALFLLALCALPLYPQTKKRPVGKIGTVRVKAPPERKNPPKAIEEKPATLGITVEKYAVTYDVNADGTAVQTWEMQQRFGERVPTAGLAADQQPAASDAVGQPARRRREQRLDERSRCCVRDSQPYLYAGS